MANENMVLKWRVETLGGLRDFLHSLTEDELDFACPKLKEWRERAIELQLEPAAMAAEQFRLIDIERRYNALTVKLHKLRRDWYRYQRKDLNQEEFEGTVVDMVEQLPRHLYRNSTVIYVAESLDQCWWLFEQDMGMLRTDEEEHDPFEQVPDDEVLDIGSEEKTGDLGEEPREMKNRNGETVATWYFTKKTAKEWADDFFGVGHFSGGDY